MAAWSPALHFSIPLMHHTCKWLEETKALAGLWFWHEGVSSATRRCWPAPRYSPFYTLCAPFPGGGPGSPASMDMPHPQFHCLELSGGLCCALSLGWQCCSSNAASACSANALQDAGTRHMGPAGMQGGYKQGDRNVRKSFGFAC